MRIVCGLHRWSPYRYQSGDYEKVIGIFRQIMNTVICGKRLFADRNIIKGWFTANCNVSECITVYYRIGLSIETPRKKPLKVIDFQGLWNVIAVRTGLEPVTPCVTGMYSNQLNQRTFKRRIRRFPDCECKGKDFILNSQITSVLFSKTQPVFFETKTSSDTKLQPETIDIG